MCEVKAIEAHSMSKLFVLLLEMNTREQRKNLPKKSIQRNTHPKIALNSKKIPFTFKIAPEKGTYTTNAQIAYTYIKRKKNDSHKVN